MYEKILSSLALECGMVKIVSATRNKRSNCGILVPGVLTVASNSKERQFYRDDHHRYNGMPPLRSFIDINWY